MPATPELAIPYPSSSDSPDGPAQLQAIAEAVEDLILERTPTGTIRATLKGTADSGWLLLDGSSVVKATYPDLDALLSAASYPYGSTGTNFTLPDWRGRSPVGVGTHADVNTLGDTDGLAVGSRTPKHSHADGTLAAAGHTHDDGTLGAVGHTHSDGTLATDSHSHGSGTLAVGAHSHGAGTIAVASHSHEAGTLAVASHTHDDGSLAVASHSHSVSIVSGGPTTTWTVEDDPSGSREIVAYNNHQHSVTGNTGSSSPTVNGTTDAAAPDVAGDTASVAPAVSGSTATATASVSSGSTATSGAGVTGDTGSATADVSGSTGSSGADVTGSTGTDGPAYATCYWQVKT